MGSGSSTFSTFLGSVLSTRWGFIPASKHLEKKQARLRPDYVIFIISLSISAAFALYSRLLVNNTVIILGTRIITEKKNRIYHTPEESSENKNHEYKFRFSLPFF